MRKVPESLDLHLTSGNCSFETAPSTRAAIFLFYFLAIRGARGRYSLRQVLCGGLSGVACGPPSGGLLALEAAPAAADPALVGAPLHRLLPERAGDEAQPPRTPHRLRRVRHLRYACPHRACCAHDWLRAW